MKKFLALLFVCAGLTAMAGVPQINKAHFAQANKGQKVMKANTLSQELCAPAMQQNSKDMLTPRKLMKDLNMTFGDNRLNRKAPRRLSNEDILNFPYLDFRYVYTIKDGQFVESDYHYRGGEGVYFMEDDGEMYCAGLYWNPFTGSCYYLPLAIDYANHEVSFETGYYLDNDTIEGRTVNNKRVDTVDVSIMVDFNWFTSDDENAQFASIVGTIFDDGTIQFDDENPYVVFGYRVLNTFTRSGNPFSGYTYQLTATDTTHFTDIYSSTQFIVPNATHDYDLNGQNGIEHMNDNAYMYQYDDTTAAVFNLYGMGMPGIAMNIYPDGTMKYELNQYLSEMGPATRNYYANYYGAAYNWDQTHYYWPVAMDDETLEEVEDEVKYGTVEPTAIKWGAMGYVLPGIVRVADGAMMQLGSYPFTNNVLAFTDGSEFVLGGEPQFILGDVNRDGIVNIEDLANLVDHLLKSDFDDADNFSPDAADVDESGDISIADVPVLIDMLLK